jgi:hypothetical protein
METLAAKIGIESPTLYFACYCGFNLFGGTPHCVNKMTFIGANNGLSLMSFLGPLWVAAWQSPAFCNDTARFFWYRDKFGTDHHHLLTCPIHHVAMHVKTNLKILFLLVFVSFCNNFWFFKKNSHYWLAFVLLLVHDNSK